MSEARQMGDVQNERLYPTASLSWYAVIGQDR